MAATFSFSLRDKWGLGAAAGVALCLGLGGWAYNSMGGGKVNAAPMRPQQAASKATAAPLTLPAGGGGETFAAGAASASPALTDTLMVHITGSVKTPGVYKLKPGDRINDAVKAAGGFKANAQQDALNLADTVQDADQIFVPAQQAAAAKTKAGQTSSAPAYSDTAPVYVSAPPRHRPLIIRGTPVKTALAAAVRSTPADASTNPAQNEAVPTAADLSGGTPDAAASSEETTHAQNAPVHQGRVLGRPAAPVAASAEGDGAAAGEGDPQENAPVPVVGGAPPVYSPAAKTSKSRTARSTAGGSVRRTGGPAAKAGGTTKFKNPGDGVVHLNSAGASELEKLPGVGPAMSGRILEYRHQIGGFKSVEQIMDVKGIGDKKFAKMRPFLAL